MRVLRNLSFVAVQRVIVVMVYLICSILVSLCVKNVLQVSYTLLFPSVSIPFSSQYLMLLIVFWRSHLLREIFSFILSQWEIPLFGEVPFCLCENDCGWIKNLNDVWDFTMFGRLIDGKIFGICREFSRNRGGVAVIFKIYFDSVST